MKKTNPKRRQQKIDWEAVFLFFFTLFFLIGMVVFLISEVREYAIENEPSTSAHEMYTPSGTEKRPTENPEEVGGVDPMDTYDEAPEQKYIGECRLTVYTPYCDNGKWGYKTSTGEQSQHLMTCAVDPEVIPYGSNVIIREGEKELRLKAVDCGSAVEGKRIDIFYDGRITAAIDWLDYNFGDYAEVWIETIETIE